VLLIEPYDDFEDALAQVNHSSMDCSRAAHARFRPHPHRVSRAGSWLADRGDTPNWRLDPMPMAESRTPAWAARAFAGPFKK